MNHVKTSHIHMTGAQISFSTRGSGPLLLLIAGGEGSGDGYDRMAGILSDRYTVVTYDRRGAPGSPLEDPDEDVHLETHSDDAHHLLAALTGEPAHVFGSSAGALVGLDLLIRYPQQVRILVAHEPPVEGVLPEFDRYQAEMAEARQKDPRAAMIKFITSLGINYEDMEPGAVLPPRDPQQAILRGQALMRYTFPAVHKYHLDIAALTNMLSRLVLAGGSAGRSTPTYRCTQALAQRLGMSLVEFPSHHAGYVNHPRAFAARLDEVLKGG